MRSRETHPDMKVNVKKLREGARLPVYGTQFAAGADLYALEEQPVVIPAGETRFIHTGIAVELEEGKVGLVCARSGPSGKQEQVPAAKGGGVDRADRGEVLVALHNHGKETRTVESGDRIAQLVVAPVLHAEFEEAEELSATVRGAGGFGSTGKNG